MKRLSLAILLLSLGVQASAMASTTEAEMAATQAPQQLRQPRNLVQQAAVASADVLHQLIESHNVKGITDKLYNWITKKNFIEAKKTIDRLPRDLFAQVAEAYILRYGKPLDFKALAIADANVPEYGVSFKQLDDAGIISHKIRFLVSPFVRVTIYKLNNMHINSLVGIPSENLAPGTAWWKRAIEFELANNKITNLEGIYFSNRTKALNLENNELTSIDNCTFSPNTQMLNFNNNKLTSIENVQFPTGAAKLWFRYNQISDISQKVVDQFNHLEELRLRNTLFMGNIYVIDLRNNPLNEETKARLRLLGKRVLFDETPNQEID